MDPRFSMSALTLLNDVKALASGGAHGADWDQVTWTGNNRLAAARMTEKRFMASWFCLGQVKWRIPDDSTLAPFIK
jgi:hypothetical protein